MQSSQANGNKLGKAPKKVPTVEIPKPLYDLLENFNNEHNFEIADQMLLDMLILCMYSNQLSGKQYANMTELYITLSKLLKGIFTHMPDKFLSIKDVA